MPEVYRIQGINREFSGRFIDTLPLTSLIVEHGQKATPENLQQHVYGPLAGIGRGDRYEDFIKYRSENEVGSSDFESLSEMFARKVSGKGVQNIIMVLFGPPGSGKSMALLSLAIYCAMWLAYLKKKKVTDFFTLQNIAVIEKEYLGQMMSNLKPWNIYVLDDIATSFDARAAMSRDNRDLSHTLETCRTSRNIILCSAPAGQMVDVNLKRVAGYYAETSEIHHSQGYTLLKVFRLSASSRSNTMYRIYLTHRNLRAIRHLSTLPPPRLKRVYDKVRTRQAEDIALARQKRLAPKEKKPRGNFGDRWTQEEFNEQIRPHMKQPTTMRKVCDSIGVAPDTLKRYMRKYGFKAERIRNTQNSRIRRIK